MPSKPVKRAILEFIIESSSSKNDTANPVDQRPRCLSQSPHADRFLLKGALLFTLWYDMPHRPTRDADLLGFGPSDLQSIGQTFRDIASIAVDDGITFDPESVNAGEIRKDAGYAGARVVITGDQPCGAHTENLTWPTFAKLRYDLFTDFTPTNE